MLTSTKDDKQLANDFVKFVSEKIEKLCAKFKNLPETNIQLNTDERNIRSLSRFEETTEDEILQMISTYGIKCSPEDPAPVKVLKDNMLVFLPIWNELVNFSLEMGSIEKCCCSTQHKGNG